MWNDECGARLTRALGRMSSQGHKYCCEKYILRLYLRSLFIFLLFPTVNIGEKDDVPCIDDDDDDDVGVYRLCGEIGRPYLSNHLILYLQNDAHMIICCCFERAAGVLLMKCFAHRLAIFAGGYVIWGKDNDTKTIIILV